MIKHVRYFRTRFLLIVCLFGTSTAVEVWDQDDNVGELLSNPRLAFHPNPDGETTLIRFNKHRPSTYMKYVNGTNKILSEYLNNKWYDWISCGSYDKYRPERYFDDACHFNLNDLGAECFDDTFGFWSGQPCILFNLERIYNWLPVPYENNSVPDNIRDLWSQYAVTLKCDTTDAPSRDNIGNITYHPTNGFPFKYIPYTGQPAWRPHLCLCGLSTRGQL